MQIDMINRDKRIEAEDSTKEREWPYVRAMTSIFIVAEPKRSKDAATEFKKYVTDFFEQPDLSYSECIRRDVAAFRRVNAYLKSVDPDIGNETTLGRVAWLKLAHGYWADFGVRNQNGHVDQTLQDYRRAFQNKYLQYRNRYRHRSRLTLVVPDEIFCRLESGDLDVEGVEKQSECYALDVFLLCDIGDGWLSKRWRVWYVDLQFAPQLSVTTAIPGRIGGTKNKKRGARLAKASLLRDKLGPENCRKMERALAQAVEDGGFGGLLDAPKYNGDQYRFNGTRKELYVRLSPGYGITRSKSSGLKLISFYVLCRVWS